MDYKAKERARIALRNLIRSYHAGVKYDGGRDSERHSADINKLLHRMNGLRGNW